MMHPYGLSPPFTFITREGLTPKHSHKCSTPWSVFQDGSLMTITPASLPEREPRSPQGYYVPGYNTPRRELRSRGLYPPTKTDAGLGRAKCTGEEHRMIRPAKVWS